MGLYEYVTALVIFIVAVTGIIGLTTTIANNYGQSPTGDLGITADYAQANTTENLAFALYDNIDSGAIESSSTDFGIVRGSVGAIKQTYNAYNTTKYLAKEVQKEYNIPTIYYTGFITISLLSVIFSIIYMVFRFRG